jgi:antitoxin HicB
MKKHETLLNYTVIYRLEPEGGYTVLVPALPGCVTFGKTLAKARRMGLEAIQLYVDCTFIKA